MIWFVVGCGVIALIVVGKKIYDRFCLEKRCTGVASGHYLYPEWTGKLNGRSVETRWNPVYEYTVGASYLIAQQMPHGAVYPRPALRVRQHYDAAFYAHG